MDSILIVDDSSSMRNMIDFTLCENGFDCIKAENGKLGCDLLGNKFKLIITDLYMPEMNGIEFIKNIRSTGSNKYTPIIMLTTESEENKKNEGISAGASAMYI